MSGLSADPRQSGVVVVAAWARTDLVARVSVAPRRSYPVNLGVAAQLYGAGFIVRRVASFLFF